MVGLEILAPRLGGLAWIAGELFAIEGRWAASMSSPAAVEHLATHSRHHGWHVSLWTGALPDSPALDAARHVAPPSPGWARAVAAVDDPSIATDAHRLAALYRCLVPRLIVDLAELSADLGGPGDAAIERVVGLVTYDVAADLHGGLRLLVATLRDDEMVEIAGVVTKMLDQAFRT